MIAQVLPDPKVRTSDGTSPSTTASVAAAIVPSSANNTNSTVTASIATPSSVSRSWVHFVAGGAGGMAAAAFTAPLDVLRTRLQSDFYKTQLLESRAANGHTSTGGILHPVKAAGRHLNETLQILANVWRTEGPRALFKGLGPNLVGVVPARSIHFYTYGNGKQMISEHLNNGREAAWVHLSAAALAGVATATATNPIWMIKTRLQLDKDTATKKGSASLRRYRNAFDCAAQVLRSEGISAMYKGMSASYLGVAESTLQWMLYEEMKRRLALREMRIQARGGERTAWDRVGDIMGKLSAAGGAKLVASIITYPHEVARTRLRQAPAADGRPKYTGLVQCFKLVWKEEGFAGLYGGMTPHLLRAVPNAAIMFGIYEGVLHLFSQS
ncbi:Mitochondrial carrier protein RIM2 [Ceratocystis fimbriata CBS 114723]|uniref:Mitochondrial carrier protein RIM2 n=1 Tax=Ceratocystis fimbriata CBS 114723 TaxID=1035309 RepID=A0A2C5WYQ0_9PEZI|nr:Mitochondrial carrier protein RIM2 [Ceratocystis fimbriata CBS 114723]